jgi:two-component system phosphate regulon sensor histidine kinase PhoR
MMYVAAPVRNNGRTIAVLRVSLFISEIDDLLADLRGAIIRITLLIIGISLLGALLFSRALSGPIDKLRAAAVKVGTGDFNVKVYLKGRNEFTELAESFNLMTDKVGSLFHELSCQKEELQTIISSIREGLVMLDRQDRIEFSNESFRAIAGNKEIEGRYFWEVFRDQRLNKMITSARADHGNRIAEIERDGTFYLASISVLSASGALIIVLQDVTEIRNLERLKREFVANVSHELRTPLTAIKGFIETMEEEIDESNRYYLGIIRKNTERLINIVSDLLLLSRLEKAEMRIDCDAVHLPQLIGSVTKLFEERCRNKGLSLRVEVDQEVGTIQSDSFHLEQILINLIDNAVKYTETGSINVKAQRVTSGIQLCVEDTGIGIPPEHQKRIFERFYVVDKSRSRTLGGTGLGLSIVKHIVLLHGGTIDVTSTPGKGTAFTVVLP